MIQNCGRGSVITGTREWTDYRVQAVVTPHLVKAFGLAARVQGQERYYALLLIGQNMIKFIKRLDGEVVLAEQALAWHYFPCQWNRSTAMQQRDSEDLPAISKDHDAIQNDVGCHG